ncbi:DsrE family protein [Paenibacillus alkalitolerans]|uniref:DsrE family protein n=1 Tax=Paenibacillus alkalitolerans TaxID=2799335 RepID=UPI0018F32F05|nr:DsrE family protein [Paenibacillus alkalitolerans]
MANKYVIIIQAGQQDVGRAVHGLLYGQELHEAGYSVDVSFDGAGTIWVKELEKPAHPFNPVFKQAMKSGIVKGGCQACSGFFEVEEEVKKAGVSLVGSEASGGHLPFAQYIKDGYFPIIL